MCENARGESGFSAPDRLDELWTTYRDELLHKYGEDHHGEVAALIEREEKQYAIMAADLERKPENARSEFGLMRKTEMLRQFGWSDENPAPLNSENPMTSTEARLLSARLECLDPIIRDAFTKAANHARETKSRRMVVESGDITTLTDTVANRIGYFVNGLRREMQPTLNEMRLASKATEWIGLCNFLHKFQDTRQWTDIAVPNPNPSLWTYSIILDGKLWSMNLARLKEILMDAQQAYTDPVLQTTDTVKTELAELEKGMVSMYESINRAKRINEQADTIIGDLSNLVETLPRSA